MGAIPAINLGIGLAMTPLKLIMGLLAAHDQRMKIAKEENAALNQAMSALSADLKTVFDALNKGDISESVAVASLQDVDTWYWQFIVPFQQGAQKGHAGCITYPGLDHVHTGPCPQNKAWDCQNANHAGTTNGQTCTAGCDVGCNIIDQIIKRAIAVVQKHGGSFLADFNAPRPKAGVGGKYGFVGTPNVTFKYVKPKKVIEAEVTINTKTGKLTVGAPPTSGDFIIAGGVISRNATPDSGGDVIQHDASGADVNVTSSDIESELSLLAQSIPGGMTTLIIAGVFLVLLAVLPSRT